jgi:N-alpha-acetyltransferase 40
MGRHRLRLLKRVGRYTKSSMGWDPPSKKQELFHRDSRFVLLRRSQAEDGLEHLHEELPILAYSMFRFDMEDDECVLYWYGRLSMTSHSSRGALICCASYELQVSQSAQRGGMGKTLMGYLYDIARRWNMRKVMLTVFKGERENALVSLGLSPVLRGYSAENQAAFSFYKAMGLVRFSH